MSRGGECEERTICLEWECTRGEEEARELERQRHIEEEHNRESNIYYNVIFSVKGYQQYFMFVSCPSQKGNHDDTRSIVSFLFFF